MRDPSSSSQSPKGPKQLLKTHLDETADPIADRAKAEGVDPGHRERILEIRAEDVVRTLEKRLSLMAVLARLAPLLGLLGTILGMIATFAHIADSSSGINMTLLASGIWQALLTTAAGLSIAIPSLLALHWFRQRVSDIADALNATANAALSIQRIRKP